jgi:outer membrane protein assembly factor BamA
VTLLSRPRTRALLCALFVCLAAPAQAQSEPGADALPSLAALEAAGAVIGEIRIKPLDIFDLDDPAENNALFRAANWLHIQTRPGTLQRQLLFASGERLSARVIEETERLLRASPYLYDVDIRAVAWRDGIVDLEVRTRDTWSLQPGASVKYAGGTTSGGVSLRDDNLFGTGMSFSIARDSSSEVSTASGTRNNLEVNFSYPYAFDGHTTVAYGQSSSDEGSARSFRLDRPFYALDSRWAAGASAARDDRVVSSYAGGVVAAQYQRRHKSAHALLGRSRGLVGGWAHRVSSGLRYTDEMYATEPGLTGPAQLPAERTLVVPFLRYEAVQDEFREFKNLDQIGRPEYRLLGWYASLEFGRAVRGLGSTQAVSQYAGSVSKGTRVAADGTLLAAASFSGEYVGGRIDRGQFSASARYYKRREDRTVIYVSLAADATRFSDATQYLSLGGETALRGYPTNYQLGAHRVLFTAERRFYSDWYPFRLFRVGGAVFYDLGRAWGGPYESASSRHWPSDVGFGLRLLSARSSSGSTLHMDIAFPLKREPGVKTYQFSLQSKTGF